MENKDEYNITVHDQFGGYNNTQFNAKFRLRHVRALGPRYMIELTAPGCDINEEEHRSCIYHFIRNCDL